MNGVRMNNDSTRLFRKLETFKKILLLEDWQITIVAGVRPEDMEVESAAGCVNYLESMKTAKIQIIDPYFYPGPDPFDEDKILFHELLHLKTCLLCEEDLNSLQTRYVHQLVEDLARALSAALHMPPQVLEVKE